MGEEGGSFSLAKEMRITVVITSKLETRSHAPVSGCRFGVNLAI